MATSVATSQHFRAPMASVLLGILGWFAAGFFAKPLLDFLNLRSQVHEEITYTANVSAMVAEADLKQAALSLRRFAAKVRPTSVTASPFLRWFLSWWGYNLTKASGGLFGMANSLGRSDGSPALHLNAVQVGLKLPRDYNEESLSQIADRIAKGTA